MGTLVLEDEDIFQNILSRLPAISFAYVAYVNKFWSKSCRQILSYPKLAFALPLNPYLPINT